MENLNSRINILKNRVRVLQEFKTKLLRASAAIKEKIFDTLSKETQPDIWFSASFYFDQENIENAENQAKIFSEIIKEFQDEISLLKTCNKKKIKSFHKKVIFHRRS